MHSTCNQSKKVARMLFEAVGTLPLLNPYHLKLTFVHLLKLKGQKENRLILVLFFLFITIG